MEETVQVTLLKTRIREAINRELGSPYVNVQSIIEVQQIGESGLHFVRAILTQHIVCDCMIMDYAGYAVAFFSASFIRSFIVDPLLKQYTVEHPWIAGV